MSFTAEAKSKVVTTHQRGAKDTGSPEVQVALWSAHIEDLTSHFQTNPKDKHSRRGLMRMVNKRRRLLSYLKRTDVTRYQKLIDTLGLRR
jgi:small subunit ribosomal protein S15